MAGTDCLARVTRSGTINSSVRTNLLKRLEKSASTLYAGLKEMCERDTTGFSRVVLQL
jgi:hypothetical protein